MFTIVQHYDIILLAVQPAGQLKGLLRRRYK